MGKQYMGGAGKLNFLTKFVIDELISSSGIKQRIELLAAKWTLQMKHVYG